MKIKSRSFINKGRFKDNGWGNGYATIHKGHPLFLKDTEFLEYFINAHGGFTYAELNQNNKDEYIVGFDTAHIYDTAEVQNEQYVKNEAENLAKQIDKFDKIGRAHV